MRSTTFILTLFLQSFDWKIGIDSNITTIFGALTIFFLVVFLVVNAFKPKNLSNNQRFFLILIVLIGFFVIACFFVDRNSLTSGINPTNPTKEICPVPDPIPKVITDTVVKVVYEKPLPAKKIERRRNPEVSPKAVSKIILNTEMTNSRLYLVLPNKDKEFIQQLSSEITEVELPKFDGNVKLKIEKDDTVWEKHFYSNSKTEEIYFSSQNILKK